MSTLDDVRRLATALPQVEESTSYGSPAFRVGGKVFATVRGARRAEIVDRLVGLGAEILVAWCHDVGEREALIAARPDRFFTTDHYRDHPSVLVRLETVDDDDLRELLEDAWDARAPQSLHPGE